MIPQELRIGNYIGNRNGFPMYITGIFMDSVYMNFNGNEGDIWEEDIKDLQPIPLTPEVLVKCGFEYGENDTANFYVNGLFCVYLPGSFFKDGRIYFDQWFTVPFCPKHLHQLQNIIYFLSGEEINYKL